MRIDLNADLGEGVTDDAGLMAVVTSANLACGYHAGDEATMARVCAMAAERGVAIGAQVSYLDRGGFGRRSMEVAAETLAQWVADQVGMLSVIGSHEGVDVAYLKPHGALYNRVIRDADQAAAVLAGSPGLDVLTLPIGEFGRLAAAEGRQVVAEGFADRGYAADRTLIPRGQPGALFDEPDEIAQNAVELARAGIVQSLCVHGDSPTAVEAAVRVRRALESAGWTLASVWATP